MDRTTVNNGLAMDTTRQNASGQENQFRTDNDFWGTYRNAPGAVDSGATGGKLSPVMIPIVYRSSLLLSFFLSDFFHGAINHPLTNERTSLSTYFYEHLKLIFY